jgi:hypothetical protein
MAEIYVTRGVYGGLNVTMDWDTLFIEPSHARELGIPTTMGKHIVSEVIAEDIEMLMKLKNRID